MEKVRVELKFDVASEDGGADSGGGEEDVRKGSEASVMFYRLQPAGTPPATRYCLPVRELAAGPLTAPALSSFIPRSPLPPCAPARSSRGVQPHILALPRPTPCPNRRTFARSHRAGDAVQRVARQGYELMRAFPGRTPASNKQLGRA